jgi:hypothetical protein
MSQQPSDPSSPKPQQGGLTLGPGAQITVGQGDVVAGDKIVIQSKEDARTRRDHLILLNKVKEFWVKGVLEKSVHAEALIELGKQTQSDAVEHERQWDLAFETSEQESGPIPPGTKIIEIFDETDHALLILGAPGSGKTITLLELARDLIVRAESDPAQPIPVVFNLSAWAERRQPLTEWMTDELSLKYQIPRKIGRKWLEDNDILPLLDGLDEVRAEYRAACVEATNAFYGEHSLAGITVCSRHEEYALLKAKLKFGGAILIQPLNDEQVKEYIGSFGTKLAGLYKALRLDATLKELAASPLMLGVMSLAYADVSLEDVLRGTLDSIEARRKHLFDAYVERMFKRKGTDKRYTPEQTVKWLAWLARGMKQRGQSEFLIEQLQPNWLPNLSLQRIYILGSGFIGGLILGVIAGLLFVVISARGDIAPAILIAVIFTLFFWAVFSFGDTTVKMAEILNWFGREALTGGGSGIIVGAMLGLIIGICRGSWSGLITGAIVGSVIGFIYGASQGLKARPKVKKLVPNQGAWLSQRNATLVGLIVFGVSLIPCLGMASLTGERMLVLGLGLIAPLFLGALATLYYGGLAVIRHYSLRIILAANQNLPWNLTHFLDYCADRIFLQRVGGGYIFIHRLLLEYFAERG